MGHCGRASVVRCAVRLVLLVVLLCVVVAAQYLGGRMAGLVIHALAVALIVTGPGLVALLLARALLPAGLKDRLLRSRGIAVTAGLGVIVFVSGLAGLSLHLAGKLVPLLKALSLLR